MLWMHCTVSGSQRTASTSAIPVPCTIQAGDSSAQLLMARAPLIHSFIHTPKRRSTGWQDVSEDSLPSLLWRRACRQQQPCSQADRCRSQEHSIKHVSQQNEACVKRELAFSALEKGLQAAAAMLFSSQMSVSRLLSFLATSAT